MILIRDTYSPWILPTIILAIRAVVMLDRVLGYYLPAKAVQGGDNKYAEIYRRRSSI